MLIRVQVCRHTNELRIVCSILSNNTHTKTKYKMRSVHMGTIAYYVTRRYNLVAPWFAWIIFFVALLTCNDL